MHLNLNVFLFFLLYGLLFSLEGTFLGVSLDTSPPPPFWDAKTKASEPPRGFLSFLEANQRRNTCFWLCLLYNPPLHKLYVNFLPKKEKKKF